MPKLFPGIFYSILAAGPSWMLGAIIASSRIRRMPLSEMLVILMKGGFFFTIWFGLIIFFYGGAVWIALWKTGQLKFWTLIFAAILPVVIYVLWAALNFGYASGWMGALAAFGVPALSVGIVLWWFTVGMYVNR